jgi:hypothetical protein
VRKAESAAPSRCSCCCSSPLRQRQVPTLTEACWQHMFDHTMLCRHWCSNGNKMQASQLRGDHTCQASHLWCCPLGRQTQTGGMSLPLPASRCRPPPPVEARGAVETAAGGDTSVARTVAKDVPQVQWSVLSVYLACLPGKESAQSCSSNLPASASRGRLRCGGQCRTAGRPPGAGWGQSQSRP